MLRRLLPIGRRGTDRTPAAPDTRIRACRAADLEAVIAVWLVANKQAHPFMTADFLTREEEKIRTVYLPNAQTWVAEAGGEIVGFVSLLGHQVGGLFLLPDWQGRRIGKALMDRAVAERGTLELDVFKINAMARQFYDRYGFQEAGEYVHADTGQPVLRLTLPAA